LGRPAEGILGVRGTSGWVTEPDVHEVSPVRTGTVRRGGRGGGPIASLLTARPASGSWL